MSPQQFKFNESYLKIFTWYLILRKIKKFLLKYILDRSFQASLRADKVRDGSNLICCRCHYHTFAVYNLDFGLIETSFFINMAEPGIMDYVHLNGIEWIHYIQMNFKHSSEIMLILTQIGDPRYAFLIYFPLTFSLHRNTGIQVIWMSCISEWLNAVFKWILHGERPYWWIHEIAKHDHIMKVPELEQYRLTCEIGPGSPSGHAMITSAVLYTMITSLVKHKLKDYKYTDSRVCKT
ncbi:hypothetical protein KUTeg_017478 [Tegillarca granosa]|uniref:glucose-6-phosphatase n=1 Tax=Tegillarca granosa TaxID=220873 RepID=A0ABQ9EK35_TEGGR|nr:hypothetical protein KUTeg_017478 [Tegillarca granosa]